MKFKKGLCKLMYLVIVTSLTFVLVGCSKHEHNFKEVSSIEAKCVEAGQVNYKCEDCEETRIALLDSLGHNEIIDQAVEGTCSVLGLTEGKHCDRCNEVLIAQEEVYADHEFVNECEKTETEGFHMISNCLHCNESKIIVKFQSTLENFSFVKVDYDGGFIFLYEVEKTYTGKLRLNTSNKELYTYMYMNDSTDFTLFHGSQSGIGDFEWEAYLGMKKLYFKFMFDNNSESTAEVNFSIHEVK